jgi:hypothetical protein
MRCKNVKPTGVGKCIFVCSDCIIERENKKKSKYITKILAK